MNITSTRYLAGLWLLCWAVASPAAPSNKIAHVVRLQFIPDRASVQKHDDSLVSGNLKAFFSDGTARIIDNSSLVDSGILPENTPDDTTMPRIAPDGRTIAWSRGRYWFNMPIDPAKPEAGDTGNFGRFVSLAEAKEYKQPASSHSLNWNASEVLLYRSSRVIAEIKPIDAFITAWRFTSDGRHIAISSMMMHGPSTYELHDLSTGRLIAHARSVIPHNQLPAWAQPLDAD